MLGESLGHYRIEARLGAGGMGVVYLARDLRLNRAVALKVLTRPASPHGKIESDLLREGRAASALNHPNICIVHEVEEIDGRAFIVMEYVVGTLLSRMIPAGGFPMEQVLHYAIQIADALEHAHERGVIHRDLKTADVIVPPDGRVKVLDFGVARMAPDPVAQVTVESTVQQAGAELVAGTRSYMAPETLKGKPAESASDIWARGVLLYEISSGELPFR